VLFKAMEFGLILHLMMKRVNQSKLHWQEGDDGTRTRDQSFADSCLTTWPRRHFYIMIFLPPKYIITRTAERPEELPLRPLLFHNIIEAGDGTRTRDLLLGKETFYRLNHARKQPCLCGKNHIPKPQACQVCENRRENVRSIAQTSPVLSHQNAESQNRTGDTRIFSPLLYRLSYLGSRRARAPYKSAA
jgi:hypothetical protein